MGVFCHVLVSTGCLLTSDHTPHTVTSQRNWRRLRFLPSPTQQRSMSWVGWRVLLHLQNLQPLPSRGFISGASYRCKGNGSCFSAEYNLLHISHLISDRQKLSPAPGTGHNWKVLVLIKTNEHPFIIWTCFLEGRASLLEPHSGAVTWAERTKAAQNRGQVHVRKGVTAGVVKSNPALPRHGCFPLCCHTWAAKAGLDLPRAKLWPSHDDSLFLCKSFSSADVPSV